MWQDVDYVLQNAHYTANRGRNLLFLDKFM